VARCSAQKLRIGIVPQTRVTSVNGEVPARPRESWNAPYEEEHVEPAVRDAEVRRDRSPTSCAVEPTGNTFGVAEKIPHMPGAVEVGQRDADEAQDDEQHADHGGHDAVAEAAADFTASEGTGSASAASGTLAAALRPVSSATR
jgi:hypothetical protein